ncbi:DUF7007 domain-containing protein [Sphingomonas sp. 2R-10]|uniref:DUF7007 domain-containing protein n=1 Tax=Sphingomonas sp. 2R-10 TaxID=3045148 RepID=UPI003FA730D7
MHPALRVAGGWYEEDGEWAKVAAGYPALFTDRERALADRTLRDWYPEAWEAVHGRLLMPEESLARDRERFDREHVADWVVIAAVRSNRHPDMVETTASLGGDRREGRRRHFLVPASDYRVGRHGFVIELANHSEIVAP